MLNFLYMTCEVTPIRLIKDKYLTTEQLVAFCVSLLTHRNEEKHHAGEREATCVAQVTCITEITRQCKMKATTENRFRSDDTLISVQRETVNVPKKKNNWCGSRDVYMSEGDSHKKKMR